ncbi:copper-translocating P-type ATPase, partial [Weissella soli]|uniref:copper-translocating P-type ATPase n=1 Tax=Weissella soli TaxID=155866 RepID=UPI003EF0967C
TLAVHDRVLVKANERVPLDGMIVEGAAQIDESLLTGEVALVAKKTGDDVVGGSLNGNQPFVMMVTKKADAGYVSQVQQLVAVAQKNKSRVENLADQVASWLFYAATMIGVLALIIWTVLNGMSFALPIAVTVFIIACPHALGLAVPLVVARLTGLAASRGLLIQNRTALEQVDRLRYVVLDKTGTLTEGKFTVQQVVAYNDVSESEILAQIAALEAGSVHPIGQSIVAYAQAQQVPVPSAGNVASITGVGVQGTINGQSLKIVSGQYLQEHGQSVALLTGPYTVSYLVTQADEVLGAIALGDQIKPQAAAFITALQARQLIPVMLTGDNEQAAQAIATELGITHVEAGLKPEDKATRVQQYQQSGLVMFVGDGVNDSLALATADLGVAIGSGTEVAINAADVVLVNSNPIDILALLDLAHQSNRKMKENLAWGAGYNVIAIPLAAGILIPFGFTLSPMVGAIIMSLSTVIVALNAMTLRLKENV